MGQHYYELISRGRGGVVGADDLNETFREERLTGRLIRVLKLLFRGLTIVVVTIATSAAFIGQGAHLIRQNSTHAGDDPLGVYASVFAQISNDNTSSTSTRRTPTPRTTESAAPRPVAPQPSSPVGGPCWFVFGFKQLHDLIPNIVGDCRDIERFDLATGNAHQPTVGGLLVWRKDDNWTAFTNGSTTWLIGPCGLQTRPNEGPFFSWEGRIGAPCPA